MSCQRGFIVKGFSTNVTFYRVFTCFRFTRQSLISVYLRSFLQLCISSWFHMLAFFLLQYKMLSLLTGAEFLLFLFHLWRVIIVYTWVHLLIKVLLVCENLLFTVMLLWGIWKEKHNRKTHNWENIILTISRSLLCEHVTHIYQWNLFFSCGRSFWTLVQVTA